MADSPDKIEELDETGFPRGVKTKLNEAIRSINLLLGTEYKFDTTSLNPVVKTNSSQGKRVVTMPRGALGASEVKQLQIYVKDQTAFQIGITHGQVAGLVEDGTDSWFVGSNGTIWAQVDVSDAMGFSNLFIFDNGTGSPPAIDDTHAFQLIGHYMTVDGSLVAQPMVDGSQGLSVCFSDPTTANRIPTWSLV